VGAEVRSLHSPKRDHVAATRVTTDVGAFLRNHANGRAQSTNDGSVSSTHCVQPLLLQTVRSTKLLPVVQLRSGVILLMGDPVIPPGYKRPLVSSLSGNLQRFGMERVAKVESLQKIIGKPVVRLSES
jgi:hypothetical protein